MTDLINYFRAHQDDILENIRAFVEIETPSGNSSHIAQLTELIAARCIALGAEVEVVQTTGGPSVYARFFADEDAANTKSLLIVGHCDTVWPLGTIARNPFKIEQNRLYGPGVFDMKAGLELALSALTAIIELQRPISRPIELFFSCDEERGSLSTRSFIEDLAVHSVAALVLEPPLPGGRVKTARKGIGQFRLKVRGRPAHAGVAPETGISAIEEMAHQILKLHGLNNHQQGISVNVGFVHGGTLSNVVAAESEAEIDVRFWKASDGEAISAILKDLKPVLHGSQIEIIGGINRPPLERSAAIAQLFAKANVVAKDLGIDLQEGSTGGGSDGNFIAACGIPVLDGLGPDGDGAHAEHEHVILDALAPRAALITRLMETI